MVFDWEREGASMRHLICFSLLAALFATAALAADVTGTWKAQVPGREGTPMEMTFTFKVEGETLTGAVSNPMGETPISNGRISGDDISFSVVMNFGGNEVKINYKGKVSGNEIKFTSQREGSDRVREFVAKKA